MIYSGSIWVPILMHGLCDFPMQFDTGAQYTKMVTGGADWIAVGGDLVIYSGIAWVLITWANVEKRERLIRRWQLAS